ncbi:MAG: ORF6N domain-containing protein [Bacteroidales bacterium]
MELIVSQKEIETRILTIRGMQVMIDSHLAELYDVETKQINRVVKRNADRFPEKFMFQLTEIEWDSLRSQIGTLKDNAILRYQIGTTIDDATLKYQIGTSKGERGGRRYLPYVFTEQGVAMLSAVLRSETAMKVSIQIMDVFVEMRKLILGNAALYQRLDKIEVKQIETDQKFEQVFKALESRNQQPETGIFFEGQVFDAYTFVAKSIKKANHSIILIDNYVNETVLTLLTKRRKDVTATIYTRQISKQLKLDIQIHNQQYPPIEVKLLADTHDRFLIIDQQELYHIGASLKDLGKKWFAFSKMDSLTLEVLNKLK